MSTNRPLLTHDSFNEHCTSTILFIHGAFDSNYDWHATAALLPEFHQLIPSYHAQKDDPPAQHGVTEAELSLDTVVDRLADLTRAKAHDGIAHVVGLSLGCHFALRLAGRFPELVVSVFGSGRNQVARALLYPGYVVTKLERVKVPEGQPADPFSLKPLRAAIRTTTECSTVLQIPRRVLVFAAMHKVAGLVSLDNAEDAKRAFRQFTSEEGDGRGSRVVKHDTLKHAWLYQKPELAADAIRAWIDEGVVLESEGFRNL